MIALALYSLIPPPLPPAGPVSGSFECLLENSDGPYAAFVSFREDAPATQVLPMVGETPAYQVFLQQLPISGGDLTAVRFEADRSIAIYAGKDGVVGRFSPIANGRSGEWFSFSARTTASNFEVIGNCVGTVSGRLERPVELTRIQIVRIDKVES